MRLDQAMIIMETYAGDHQLDDLASIEHMVKNLKNLTTVERQALTLFMDYTKEPQ